MEGAEAPFLFVQDLSPFSFFSFKQPVKNFQSNVDN